MTRKSSFTRDELLACGNGELFGPGNARLPVGNMLMMDRVTHISETGKNTAKAKSSLNWISIPTSGFLIAILFLTP